MLQWRQVLGDRKKKGGVFTRERLTWEQIQEKYPDQWVWLIDVQYRNNDGVSVESAVVKYIDKTKSELTRMVLRGEIISRHTNSDGRFQLGMVDLRRTYCTLLLKSGQNTKAVSKVIYDERMWSHVPDSI